MYQLVLANQIVTNTRVIVMREGRKPIQIDYLTPVQMYPVVTSAIDASIGSIQPL
jgi:hypothetical protein